MRFLARIRSLRRSILHRSAVEQDLSDELQFHLARRAEDLSIRRGISPREAMRLARIEFGSVEKNKEEAREHLGLRWIDDLRGDVRYACRTFRKSKGFTAAAIATLALGIGANTAIFSLMDAIMMRPLPVERPQELMSLRLQEPGSGGDPGDGFTNAIWEAVRDQQDVFSGVFAWSVPLQFDLAQIGTAQNVDGVVVSGNYFNALGIVPAVGRLIADADDRRGCLPVAVLSDGFWRTHFGAAESVVGSTLSLNRQRVEVIGVSPPSFSGVEVGKKFDVAIPLCAAALFDRRNLDSRGRWWLNIIGRMKPGMSPRVIQSRLEVLSPSVMRAALPDSGNADARQRFLQTRLVSASAATGHSMLRRRFGEPLTLLMAGVALVLLIACANLASLLLARATTRSAEIAIRTTLGASRRRLVRQLLTEAVLLSSTGALLGVCFARWSTGLLVRNLATGRNPVFVDLSPDGRVLGFTAGVAVLAGVMVGLLPALRSTGLSLIAATRNRHMAGSDRHSRFRAGRWIVSGQVALSLVLLIGGGLMLRTFVKLQTLDLGFDRSNVLVVTAKPPWFAADTVKTPPEQRAAEYDEIGRRLRAIPGVISVARSFTTPIGDDNWVNRASADAGSGPRGPEVRTYFNSVTPDYFATLRIVLLAGRDFDQRDTGKSSPVAVVNESAARQLFPGINALGRRFRRSGDAASREVVGIVKDSKYESLREVTPPTVFVPAAQAMSGGEAEEFVVRTSLPPSSVIPTVQRAVMEVNPEMPLTFDTLAGQVADNIVQERLLATLAGFFGALALILATVGLYGVLSYFVTHRQPEFGVRMALGAEPASILRLVMKDVVLVLTVGVGTGLAVASVSVNLLQRMLFGLEPRDTVTMVTSVGLLSAAALLAGYLPARRATRVNPMIALRSE